MTTAIIVELDPGARVTCDTEPGRPAIVEIIAGSVTVLLEITDQRVADQLANAAAQCRDALAEEG
ncbi:MAG: hypothetical protein IRY92_04595 [Dactylosporangium sp.]|nr:hypothetical protein [Dactylosporangium sp.]